jgi:hypothetical protein
MKLSGGATWTFQDPGAWYFAPDVRSRPPYLRQVRVEATADVDSRGRLAGLEVVDPALPLPPLPRAVEPGPDRKLTDEEARLLWLSGGGRFDGAGNAYVDGATLPDLLGKVLGGARGCAGGGASG